MCMNMKQCYLKNMDVQNCVVLSTFNNRTIPFSLHQLPCIIFLLFLLMMGWERKGFDRPP